MLLANRGTRCAVSSPRISRVIVCAAATRPGHDGAALKAAMSSSDMSSSPRNNSSTTPSGSPASKRVSIRSASPSGSAYTSGFDQKRSSGGTSSFTARSCMGGPAEVVLRRPDFAPPGSVRIARGSQAPPQGSSGEEWSPASRAVTPPSSASDALRAIRDPTGTEVTRLGHGHNRTS